MTEVAPGRLGNGYFRQDFRRIFESQIVRAEARHEHVAAKGFLVKECRSFQVHRLIEVLVEVLIETINVHSEFLQKPKSLLAVMMRGFKRLSSAVTKKKPVARFKFVAFGVAAKIIVVIENEDLR